MPDRTPPQLRHRLEPELRHRVLGALGVLDDDELDEPTRALLVAMDLIESGTATRASWDPAKHPRIPKGQPGAGRFLSMVERVKAKLQMHLDGDGDGDPFDGFSREQLRRAAKARGVTLKRGASRDEIAQALLADLGQKKTGSVKKAAAAGKTKPPRRGRDSGLARWRADAAKPGRVSSGRTKRDEYIATWDEAIARAEQDLARARERGDNFGIVHAQAMLAYQLGARQAVQAKEDPDLDRPGGGGQLAQAVDPERPLAVYGDMLHIDTDDDQFARLNLAELERIPAALHGRVAEEMARSPEGGVWLGEGGVSGLNHSADLRGERPRGWHDGATFDDVNGVYRPGQRQVIIGRTANTAEAGDRTASHEFGHALDHALGNASSTSEWMDLHKRVVADSPYLSPYFKQAEHAGAQEFWAEAFSAWMHARTPSEQSSSIPMATYIVRLHVNNNLAKDIHSYFENVARHNGVTD